MHSDAGAPSENAGSSSGSGLALLLWTLRPEYFSRACHCSNSAAGLGARVGLSVCDSTGLCCTGTPFESGLFLSFFFAFFPLHYEIPLSVGVQDFSELGGFHQST